VTAARLDFTGDLRLEQGSDYGPHLFTFRDLSLQDRKTVQILTVIVGESYKVTVYGADSDEPTRETTVSYVAQAGDTPDIVAAALVALLKVATLNVIDCQDTGLPVSTLLGEFMWFAASGSIVTIASRTCGEWPDTTPVATTPANINTTYVYDVRIDLTDVEIETTIVCSKSDQTPLETWSTALGQWVTLAPFTNGRATLLIVAADTIGWTFEAGWQETRTVDNGVAPVATRRRFEGDVRNSLSVIV